jgi:hypothetical protein
MAETVPCPECGSRQIESVGGFFIDSHCTNCDQLFGADFVEFDRAKTEFREAVIESFRSDYRRLRRFLQR